MKQRKVYVNADNLLCLLHGYRVLQPYSLQPSLQLVIPFEEYVLFMASQCNSKIILSDGLFTLDSYKEAIKQHNDGNVSLIKVYYTLDCLRVGCIELKKAIARKRSATVITLSYLEAEEVNLNDTFLRLNLLWQGDEGLRQAFEKSLNEISRIGDSTSIDLKDINEHNKNYFSYLAYIYTAYFATNKGRKFSPINIK